MLTHHFRVPGKLLWHSDSTNACVNPSTSSQGLTLIRFFYLVTGLVNRLADGAGTRAPEFLATDIYTLCLTDEAEDGVSLIICPLPNGELGW